MSPVASKLTPVSGSNSRSLVSGGAVGRLLGPLDAGARQPVGRLCRQLLGRPARAGALDALQPVGELVEEQAAPADHHAPAAGAGAPGGEDLHRQVGDAAGRAGKVARCFGGYV